MRLANLLRKILVFDLSAGVAGISARRTAKTLLIP
jgi:hypothetical protein